MNKDEAFNAMIQKDWNRKNQGKWKKTTSNMYVETG